MGQQNYGSTKKPANDKLSRRHSILTGYTPLSAAGKSFGRKTKTRKEPDFLLFKVIYQPEGNYP